MFIARIENGMAVEYPISEKEFRSRFKDTSIPLKLTAEVIASLGYALVANSDIKDFPQATKDARVVIGSVIKQGDNWVRTYTLEPVLPEERVARIQREWKTVREKRDNLIAKFEWRINRYYRQVALETPTSDNILELHKYVQELADITKQDDPFLVTFPTPPGE
jgi:hypothetical protein